MQLTLAIEVGVTIVNNNIYDLFAVPSHQAWCYLLPPSTYLQI